MGEGADWVARDKLTEVTHQSASQQETIGTSKWATGGELGECAERRETTGIEERALALGLEGEETRQEPE